MTTMKQPTTEIAQILRAAANASGIPESIVRAVAYVESRFNPSAVGKAGEVGLMQLMPFNWSPYGVTDPYDPAQNANGGAKMLAKLYEQFTGDWPATLAAYNWGAGNVRRKPRPEDWPESVQGYAAKVLNYAGLELPLPLTRPVKPGKATG